MGSENGEGKRAGVASWWHGKEMECLGMIEELTRVLVGVGGFKNVKRRR